MAEATPILALAEARLAIEPAGGLTAPITLTVVADDLAMFDLAGPRRVAAFANAICGCPAPEQGKLAFLGRDWRTEPPEKVDALRGRIGRLYGTDPWLAWLTVAENVLLGPLFHTRVPREALLAQAARLARRFGLPGLPVGFPETLTGQDLARAGLVRAFLGTPRLVVLESPTALLGTDILPGLLAEIRAVRDNGGAVLWLTCDTEEMMDRALPATQRWRLLGNRLVPLLARAA